MKKNLKRNQHRNVRVHVDFDKSIISEQPRDIHIHLPQEILGEKPKEKPQETPIEVPIQNKKGGLEFLKDWIGVFTAGAGIFTALIYLAGRSFASGYFGAMNIPSYHVSFSIWEYGEVAWMPMLIYPSFTFGSSALIGLGITKLWNWLTTHLHFLSKWSKNDTSSKKAKSVEARIWLLILLVSFLAFFFTLIASSTLYFVTKWGELAGTLNVIQNAAQVELVSDTPFYFDSNEINNQGLYIYKGYHLLTINDGKYFIFKGIDPQNCKPLLVTVIDSSNLKQVSLNAPLSFSNICTKKLPATFWDVITYVFSR